MSSANTNSESPLLVSVHVPKAAGSTVQRTLRAHFGQGFGGDYSDYPFNQSRRKRRWDAFRPRRDVDPWAHECVHGHFVAKKWLNRGRDTQLMVWVREPTQRLASHYHYWRRSYDPARHSDQRLFSRFIEEEWSFEDFALSREFRNLMSEQLWRVKPSMLDFVGVVESFERDFDRMCNQVLGAAHGIEITNVNPDRAEPAYEVDLGLQGRIEEFHNADYELYRWARSRQRG